MEDIELQAKQLGWVPQEQFRGPAEVWVDAETFVRRGEEILPIVRANNKELQTKLANTSKQVEELKQLVAAGNESLQAFQEFHKESLERALAQQRTELTKQLKDARDDGNTELEIQVQDQLDDVRQQQKELKDKPATKPAAAPAPAADTLDPVLEAWIAENPWFGTDKKRTAFAQGLAFDMRNDPANSKLIGRGFYDAVGKQVAEVFGDPTPTHSKVDMGRPSGGSGGRGGGRTFADLPAEAKAACDRFGDRLVGEGRSYKDLAAWRTQYAKDYFAGEQA